MVRETLEAVSPRWVLSWAWTSIFALALLFSGIAPSGYAILSGRIAPIGHLVLTGINDEPDRLRMEGWLVKDRDCDLDSVDYWVRYGGRWTKLRDGSVKSTRSSRNHEPGEYPFGPVEILLDDPRDVELVKIDGWHNCHDGVLRFLGFKTKTELYIGLPISTGGMRYESNCRRCSEPPEALAEAGALPRPD